MGSIARAAKNKCDHNTVSVPRTKSARLASAFSDDQCGDEYDANRRSDDQNQPVVRAELTYFKCLFSEQMDARAQGACFHPDNKSWYVPVGQDLRRFWQWLPEHYFNITVGYEDDPIFKAWVVTTYGYAENCPCGFAKNCPCCGDGVLNTGDDVCTAVCTACFTPCQEAYQQQCEAISKGQPFNMLELPGKPRSYPPPGLKPFDVFYKDHMRIEAKVNAMNLDSLRQRINLALNDASYREASYNYGQSIMTMVGVTNYPEPPELPK